MSQTPHDRAPAHVPVGGPGEGSIGYFRFADVPGAEVMDVRGVARKWAYFHETYSLCAATWVEASTDTAWRYRQRTHHMNMRGVQMMEPGEFHSNLHVAPRADFRVLLLAPCTMQRVCRELGITERHPHLTVAQLYDDGSVRAVLNQLTAIAVESGDVERLELGTYRLVEALWRDRCLEVPPVTVLPERGRKAVFRARDLIHAAWNQHLPISVLTKETQLPLATLERAFRDMFGTSPRQYQLHLRLIRGKERFRLGTASVGDVARSCGFRDPKYFSRLFKRQFGCQPSDYLKRTR